MDEDGWSLVIEDLRRLSLLVGGGANDMNAGAIDADQQALNDLASGLSAHEIDPDAHLELDDRYLRLADYSTTPTFRGFCVEVNATTLNVGTPTTVVFAADETDPGGVYNAATGEFTVPTTGYYLLSFGFSDSHTAGAVFAENWFISANFYRNGSVIDGSNYFAKDGGYLQPLESDYASIAKTYIKSLTAGDVIVVKAYTNLAGSNGTDGNYAATFLGT